MYSKFESTEDVKKYDANVVEVETEKLLKNFKYSYSYSVLDRYDSSFKGYEEEKKLEVIKNSLSNKELTKKIDLLEDAVLRNISICSEKFRASIQDAVTSYYNLLSKESEDIEENKNLSDVNSAELEALKLISSFDVESLNLYKDLSKEEEEALKLAGLKM